MKSPTDVEPGTKLVPLTTSVAAEPTPSVPTLPTDVTVGALPAFVLAVPIPRAPRSCDWTPELFVNVKSNSAVAVVLPGSVTETVIELFVMVGTPSQVSSAVADPPFVPNSNTPPVPKFVPLMVTVVVDAAPPDPVRGM